MDKLRRNPVYIFVFPLAMTFVAFTGLRIPETMYGIGEFMLLLWAVFSIIMAVKHNAPFPKIAVKTFIYLGLVILSGIIGNVISYITIYNTRTVPPAPYLEAVGLFFALLISVVFAVVADKRFTLITCKIFCIISSSLFLYYYLFEYTTGRMSVWANNPNQTALYCFFIVAFSAVLLLRRDTRFRLIYLATAWVGYITGQATDSDGFTMAVYAMILLFAAVFFVKNIKKTISWFVLIGGIAVAIFFGAEIMQWLSEYTSTWTVRGQDTVRFSLWRSGLQVFLHSPIFGMGFGGHAGINAVFAGSDAHNYFIDMLMRFGLLGTVMNFVWIGVLFRPALRNRDFYALAALVAFFVMSLTRTPFRMPVIYFFYVSMYFINTEAPEKQTDELPETAALSSLTQ